MTDGAPARGMMMARISVGVGARALQPFACVRYPHLAEAARRPLERQMSVFAPVGEASARRQVALKRPLLPSHA